MIFEIIRGGYYFGLLICSFILFAFYLAHKLPPQDLSNIVRDLLSFLTRERFYLVPTGGALAVVVTACFIQRRAYRREIKRLADERSMLMHGLKTGELKPLAEHNSSGFDIEAD